MKIHNMKIWKRVVEARVRIKVTISKQWFDFVLRVLLL